MQKKGARNTNIEKKDETNSSLSEAATTNQGVFDIGEIDELLKSVNQSGVAKLKLQKGDYKITIVRTAAQATHTQQLITPQIPTSPVHTPTPPPTASTKDETPTPPSVNTNTDTNLITIKSPMIGTFYRSSGPGKPVFVNVGDEIAVGQVLCIVEAMKLFNEIESEHSGKIVKVLIDDASPVEYDQPLFLIQP